MATYQGLTTVKRRPKDGADGVGVTTVRTEYYLSTSSTTQTGGTWQTTVPAWVTGTYIWERIVTVKDNGAETVGTPYLSQTWENLNQLKADLIEEQAKTQYHIKIEGGLIYTALMKLFDAGATGDETAGISGIVSGDTSNPAFWAGGTYADAIEGIAKIILRHNGFASFGGGTSIFNPDGSGQLAGENIIWDADGNSTSYGLIKGATAQPFHTINGFSLLQGMPIGSSWFQDDKKYAVKTNIIAHPVNPSTYTDPQGHIYEFDGGVRITLPSIDGVIIRIYNDKTNTNTGDVWINPPTNENFINKTDNLYLVGMKKLVSFMKIGNKGWFIIENKDIT